MIYDQFIYDNNCLHGVYSKFITVIIESVASHTIVIMVNVGCL